MTIDDSDPRPNGELYLRTPVLPNNTNGHNDVFGGWLMNQMDLAGATLAEEIAEGRIVTAAVEAINFLRPVEVGSSVSCYCEMVAIGKASMEINIEVWLSVMGSPVPLKAADGRFFYVAIDDDGRTRRIPR